MVKKREFYCGYCGQEITVDNIVLVPDGKDDLAKCPRCKMTVSVYYNVRK